MLVNINYKGILSVGLDKLEYNSWKPRQCILKYPEYKIIIFKTGKCRIMGCKKEINVSNLPLPIKIERIQSITITFSYGECINLYKWKDLDKTATYEPELFPALRINDFKPLCVNVFATGKIVVLGLKSLNFQKTVDDIINYVNMFNFQ